MPPEPLPWDRKERRIERASSDNLGSSRWREPPPSNRWGSADFRRPSPGYGKQSGWHVFSEYSFHGSGSSSRSNDEERYRLYGRYGRNSGRESRGGPEPFSRRDWRGQSWNAAVSAPMNGSVRMPGDVNERRPVDGVPRYKAHNCSDNGRNSNQLQLKDQNGRKDGGVNDLGTGQRFEGKSSLSSIDWKLMKWTRSGSLSSRGSGFSHSSSSKSTGVDSGETKVEGIPQNVPPLQSPYGNGATACMTSTALSEETGSRKKPRLGWGEGLAKFEKKNVDVPDDNAEHNGVIFCESNIEPLHREISNVLDRSPWVNGSLDSASPATPSSVACSSSPGVEDNTSVKMVNVGNANLCNSPCAESQEPSTGLSFNLENLEMITTESLGSSLSELLQYGNQSSVDSDFVKFTALNKVLVLKADISKKLEVTESEIDSLENELNSLISENSTACQCPASSSSLPRMPSETPGDVSNLIPRPTTLELQSSDDVIMDPACDALVEIAESRDEEIDGPGTPTSKFSDAPLRKEEYEDDIVKDDEYLGNVMRNGTANIVLKSSVFADSEESKDATSGKHFADSSCHIPSTDVGVHRENVLCDLIIASNKESAYIASAELNKSLPANLCCIGSLRVENNPSCDISLVVKEKFAMRHRFRMFKERVITLKFRAFQHLWKEDLRLLSMRRRRAKSQKKFELSLRMPHTGCQKHRSSSVHSRFSSPAGNLSLVPTTEVINFASKLLVDCHVKMYRSNLKMPALILDKKEMVISRFVSTNRLVEDPCAAEKGRCMINPWTSIEKEIFLDKFTIFGKNFRKIACFLDHKTTADCVEFYYKNHKSDFFQKAKKQPEFEKKKKSNSTSTYLVTSGKRWDRNNGAVSLDILGVASEIAGNVDDGLKSYQNCATRVSVGTSNNCKTTWGNTGMLERASSPVAMANERETLAADVLAGICNSFSSEAMSSCITSSVDFGEGNQERKGKMLCNYGMRPLTPEVDDETCSDESCGEMDPTNWTDEEKSAFIQAVASYGKDFTKISRCVRTRSSDQCKIFFSKARKCFGLDVMQPRPCSDGAAVSDEYNEGGGSVTEDACVVEDGSVICHKESGSKKDEDIPPSSIQVSRDRTFIAGTIHVDPEPNQLEEDNRDGELNVKATEFRPENATSDECSDNKLDLNLESISNTDNCTGKDSLSVDTSWEELAIMDTESGKSQATERTLVESVVGLEGNDDGKSSVSVACAEVKSEGEIYTDNAGVENTGYELLLGSNLNEKLVGIVDINMNNLSGVNCSVHGTRILPLLSENSSASVDTESFSIGAPTVYKHRNMMNSNPVQKALVGSLNGCNDYTPTIGLLQDAVALMNGKNLTHDLGLNILPQNLRNQQFQNSAITDDCQKRMCERSSIYQLDPPKIFKGYPVPMSFKNQTNGDIVCNKPGLQATSDVDRSYLSGQLLPKDLHREKCKSSGADHSLSQDPMQDPSKKSKPQCSSDSDIPTRKGDIKLFGQILSHPPTQHKPNYKLQERDDRSSQHPKLSDHSFNLKLTGNQKFDEILASAKFELNNSLALDNLPMRRSFGFWDGNRIQTGCPLLPDSAILLAKYPAAFSNYSMASSRIEKQQINSSIVSNDCNLNGTSVFPTRDINGSKGAADFPAYESRDLLQPYTVDLKQHQDMFLSETRIQRNDFDATSSLQLRARGMVGINVGTGSILSGGPRPGVSDPVAALKMHYAKTEQYVAQAGSILRDGEMWRSTGDLSR